MTYSIVWEFQVPGERAADIEADNGPHGAWARLFGQAEGFIGVDLLHSTEREGRNLTIDRWVSQSAFEAFQARFATDLQGVRRAFGRHCDNGNTYWSVCERRPNEGKPALGRHP